MRLARVQDVEASLGQSIPDNQQERVEFILDKLSEAFIARARNPFEVRTYKHRLKVNGGRALPNRIPLLSVQRVESDRGKTIPWQVRQGAIIVDASLDFVIVTYTAGYETIPKVVRLQIAESARRVYQIPDFAKQGIAQHTHSAGPFSKTYQVATWAVGGQSILSPDDIALADRFRPVRAGNIWRS